MLLEFDKEMKWLILELPEELRKRLKKPLGDLISGSEENIYKKILSLIGRYKPLRVVSVGDRVSRFLVDHGIETDVIIIDQRERRNTCPSPLRKVTKYRLKASNKPGHIESGAWNTVAEALNKGNSTVIINGEEDLLVLAAVSLAPKGTLILYGQPDIGVVAVKVTDKLKQFIKEEIIRKMIIQ